jgi:pyrimidine deaminase RibD-like protein
MPGLKAAQSQTDMRASDFERSDQDQLDEILTGLCELVIQGQHKNQDLGMVAAAVLDPDMNCVVGINYPTRNGKRVHAERAAIDSYTARFGPVPPGSTVVTTLNPCSHDMAEREGSSCTDLVQQHGIHKVYCGVIDPEQVINNPAFDLEVTSNSKIQALCKAFANTFLKHKLDELSFLGSPCTKDCSGHRAGYAWSQARGGVAGNSPFSPSFNNGANLFVAGK